MPDFIDRLGAELLHAANAEPAPAATTRGARRPRRLGSLRLRGLLVVPAVVIAGAGAAIAGGVLLTGAPARPRVPPVPSSGYGTATGTRLLALHVADPGGGLPWGLRAVLTTRHDVCLQVGRLADGTIGVLGLDGAFGNDHRFHPFTANAQNEEGCVPLDARGHGFTDAFISGLPKSAMTEGGCIAQTNRNQGFNCPLQDTRNVYFGLLGPRALSISYVSATGRTVTVPTVGPDGAYLIITRGRAGVHQGDGGTAGGLVRNGPIRAVTYRGGHTCRPTTTTLCWPVGMVPVKSPKLTQKLLASPIRVTVTRAHTPRPRSQPFWMIRVTYTAHVAVNSTASFYYTSLFFPSNGSCGYGVGDPTGSNIHAGQRIVTRLEAGSGCHGMIDGLVRYHPASAIHSPAPEADRHAKGDITVGSFRVRIR
jgi:hypothetical protein